MVRFPAKLALLAILAAPLSLMAQAPAAPTPAQTSSATTVVTPPTPLLPDKFGEWQASGPADTSIHLPDNIAAELIVKRSDAKKYAAEGNASIVSATEFADATGAYSAYTLLRTPEMHRCAGGNSLGVDCSISSGTMIFWQGDTLVQIAPAGNKAISASSFNELVGMLPKPRGAKGAHPLLPSRLPQDGLEKESLRYAVGALTYAAEGGSLPANVIDFSKSPEIITARYHGGKSGNGLLTMIFYPTPTIAGDRLRAIEKAIDDKSLPASFLTGDPKSARSGPIVAIAAGGFTARQASRMVGGIKYEANISWNKPEGYMEQFKVSQAASVMVQIMIFVIVMVGAALALGIVFGGGRAAIRKARGKPLSTMNDIEVISLGLRGPANRKLQ
ncbi:DUF6599 family protein [Terriglobus roseus]|uniref:Uncharacterized protein n=1 Tax=Terriglobus roseus TaxID=392734 RepID=A0A1H4LDG3_9BACT|nr:DUF6599 family protein [Terriglobus roseus]SEB68809.1 hypothetical protein SAMN05443244_1560 [Terriglobus roseus]